MKFVLFQHFVKRVEDVKILINIFVKMMKNNDLKKIVLSPTESIHSSTSYSEPSVVVKEKKEQTHFKVKSVHKSLCREACTTFPLKIFEGSNSPTKN